MPAFVALLSLIADVSLIFNGQAQVTRVVQDANRMASIGRLEALSDVETYISQQLTRFEPNLSVTSSVDADNVLTSVVSVPAANMQAIGWLSVLTGSTVTVRAQQFIERGESLS
ncbi:hypothetical protein OG2516_06374 [Oceanicola granulosus HTCC2516]|uniref:Uncharacterized protein n=1 Tax=Oceanicola granulosus (strain ATCC BAA-861 / DSM 15982 / KCTC 12143 / HTCC2516) TaxID=314256 RepID=Q2CBQ7_OCEGH|nr:hypothetical protein OG2516_06374 [Oceanicola granulosus HTCC2516]